MSPKVAIKTDSLSKRLYAQDASMYEEMPQGVAFPETGEDMVSLVKQAAAKKWSITVRSAGTSLAGQTTGNGLIMDVSRHMTKVLEWNIEQRWVRVEPGIIRDQLNRLAAPQELLFGPDTATASRCMIGGMIGNNSAGLYSIKYGSTRNHVLEMDVVLSDSSRMVAKPLTEEELKQKCALKNLEGHIYRETLELLKDHKEAIEQHYPHKDIKRRNTGYALDALCEMHPITPGGRPFNLCELLAGSEGTLAMTVSAKLNLEPLPRYKRMMIPQFMQLDEAMRATVLAVEKNPAAVELVDDIILQATKENLEQAQNRFFLREDPKCILIIQFEGDNRFELDKKAQELEEELKAAGLGYAYSQLEDPERMNRVWELRKAGLGLLMGLGKESRSPAFCEDTAVRVKDLPEYVKDIEAILDKHDTHCVFYAHASVGELHFRPMIDTTTLEGVTKMKQMAKEFAETVHKYNGSLSGEHGDGRARAPFIETVLGAEMMPLLERVKDIWDPEIRFNPGKIVRAKPMDKDLRYSPDYTPMAVPTVFKWRKVGGFNEALELCNGAGVCRKLAESGGTMCPSYMATTHEKDSTRGRANVFRHVFSGANPEGFSSKDLKEALSLCLSCKACKSECPANVDMAKMKAEFMHGYHQKHGVSRKEEFFGDPAKRYPLAARFASITNRVAKSPVGKQVLKQAFGVSPLRDLPEFSTERFRDWFRKHPSPPSDFKVILLADLFTDYHDPRVGKHAVWVLEAMGFEVMLPKVQELGRTFLSKGLMDKALKTAETVVQGLAPFAHKNYPFIGLEPSEILTIRDEYLDLVPDSLLGSAQVLASKTYTFEEFVALHKNRFPKDRLNPVSAPPKVALHGHCHTKALIGNRATIKALELAGYLVEAMDTGCCGMAGSFGYDEDTYELSMQIGWQRLFPKLGNLESETFVCAPGFSCRHQIHDGVGMRALHPATLIAQRIGL
jgi:FAD/FMN-containing dehydrogenase/Fe-S oxidoreductase